MILILPLTFPTLGWRRPTQDSASLFFTRALLVGGILSPLFFTPSVLREECRPRQRISFLFSALRALYKNTGVYQNNSQTGTGNIRS